MENQKQIWLSEKREKEASEQQQQQQIEENRSVQCKKAAEQSKFNSKNSNLKRDSPKDINRKQEQDEFNGKCTRPKINIESKSDETKIKAAQEVSSSNDDARSAAESNDATSSNYPRSEYSSTEEQEQESSTDDILNCMLRLQDMIKSAVNHKPRPEQLQRYLLVAFGLSELLRILQCKIDWMKWDFRVLWAYSKEDVLIRRAIEAPSGAQNLVSNSKACDESKLQSASGSECNAAAVDPAAPTLVAAPGPQPTVPAAAPAAACDNDESRNLREQQPEKPPEFQNNPMREQEHTSFLNEMEEILNDCAPCLKLEDFKKLRNPSEIEYAASFKALPPVPRVSQIMQRLKEQQQPVQQERDQQPVLEQKQDASKHNSPKSDSSNSNSNHNHKPNSKSKSKSKIKGKSNSNSKSSKSKGNVLGKRDSQPTLTQYIAANQPRKKKPRLAQHARKKADPMDLMSIDLTWQSSASNTQEQAIVEESTSDFHSSDSDFFTDDSLFPVPKMKKVRNKRRKRRLSKKWDSIQKKKRNRNKKKKKKKKKKHKISARGFAAESDDSSQEVPAKLFGNVHGFQRESASNQECEQKCVKTFFTGAGKSTGVQLLSKSRKATRAMLLRQRFLDKQQQNFK